MRVHVLASYNVISFYFFYPLWALRARLRARQCEIHFLDKIGPLATAGADVLLIDNRFFTPLWKDRSAEAYRNLEVLRKRYPRLIWVDVTDSTGATQFRVLPFVDRYWKKQLLKDRRLYERDFYDARIYTDYYRQRNDLPRESDFRVEALPPGEEHKLALAWNLGLGPYHTGPRQNDLVRRLPHFVKERLPWPYGFRVPAGTGRRKSDICFRGSDRYNNLALAFQRLEIKRRLSARGIDTRPTGYRRYIRELRTARIGVSPFGAGEICFRDFEIMQSGCLLFKPDLGHLETWPEFFEPMVTYVPFAWDFHDFDPRLDELLAAPEQTARISRQAQQRYLACYSNEGKEELMNRFLKLVA